MRKNTLSFAAAAVALLLLAACGSSSPMGDIFGSGNGNGNGNYNTEIRGTVDSVDLNSGSIYLINATNSNSGMLSSGGGNSYRVYFDNRTTVDYNGRSFRPEDLERGDQVAVRVDQSSNRPYATSMSVLYDARNSNTSGTYPSTYPSNGT